MTGSRKRILLVAIPLIFILGGGLAVYFLIFHHTQRPHMALVYKFVDLKGSAPNPDFLALLAKMLNVRLGKEYGLRIEPWGQDGVVVRVPTEANVPKLTLEEVNELMRSSFGGGLEMRIAPTIAGASSSGSAGMNISADEANRLIGAFPEDGSASTPGGGPFGWFPVNRNEKLGDGLVTVESNSRTFVLLSEDPNFTWVPPAGTSWLKEAYPVTDQMAKPAISFGLTKDGAARFSALTGSNIKSQLAILIGGEVYSAPRINSRISNRGMITGTFKKAEVERLATRVSNSANCPVKILLPPVSVTYQEK